MKEEKNLTTIGEGNILTSPTLDEHKLATWDQIAIQESSIANAKKVLLSDLEGTLMIELWPHIGEMVGTDELKKTTKEIADYSALMTHRLNVLERENLTREKIRDYIKEAAFLDGAETFLAWAYKNYDYVIIVTDNYYPFVETFFTTKNALHPKLRFVAQNILTDKKRESLTGFEILSSQKKAFTKKLKAADIEVHAIGDSLNDIDMLEEADKKVLLRASRETLTVAKNISNASTYNEIINFLEN